MACITSRTSNGPGVQNLSISPNMSGGAMSLTRIWPTFGTSGSWKPFKRARRLGNSGPTHRVKLRNASTRHEPSTCNPAASAAHSARILALNWIRRQKGRMYQKLTEDAVRQIIAELSRRSGPSLKEIAGAHGTSVSTVSQILRGVIWRQVPRPTGLPGFKH